jgi:glycosyltransferase involved in cell wall biosynthesis
MMNVSIIIPTHNRLEQLKRVLAGLEDQTYPADNFEVLVVSDGSTDDTDEFLLSVVSSLQLRAFFQANQGAAAARNLAIAQAVGDIVLFLDDDVFPAPELIEEHLRFHSLYGDCAVVIGPMLAPVDYEPSPWIRWELEKLAEQYHDMTTEKWAPTARQFYTGNTSLARRHLMMSGGFDPTFRRAEDIELAYRLAQRGLKFFFNPSAAGYHYAERSFFSWLAIPYAYGRNNVIFSRQPGQTWLITNVFEEFQSRHSLIRLLTQLCLDRPRVSAAVTGILSHIIQISHQLKLKRLPQMACGVLFNLRFYQGTADELNGRRAFFHGIESFRPSS